MFRKGFARCPLDGGILEEIAADPLEGAVFAERYVIEHCVGEGGMGRVYRATHSRMSRSFAIKVLFGEHAAEQEMQVRFAREAEAACRLRHPNVVSVTDFGETEQGLFYMVMDWVEGERLTDVVHHDAPLPNERTIDIARQICFGLAHAHGQGLVHRDLKSENIIVSREGDAELVRIVDFGLAVGIETDSDSRLTAEGMVYGTPAYMPPEQACGVALDGRTDLYSLGVLMYEMLSGVLPFMGAPMDIVRQNMEADPPTIKERIPEVDADPGLEAISRKLMAKKPEERFQSAEAVVVALDECAVRLFGSARSSVPMQSPRIGSGMQLSRPESTSASTTASVEPAVSVQVSPGRRSTVRVARRPWAWALVALVVLAAAGSAWVLLRPGGGAHAFLPGAESGESGKPDDMDEPGPTLARSPTSGAVVARPAAGDQPDDGAGEVGASDDDVIIFDQPDDMAPTGAEVADDTPGADSPSDADSAGDDGASAESGDTDVASGRGDGKRAANSRRARRARRHNRRAKAREQRAASADKPVTMDTLERLHKEVGQLAHRLASERPGGDAEALSREYLNVPFAASINNATLRPQVHKQLLSLRRRIKAALSK